MANNIVFLEKWKNELMEDEFSPLNEEEVAYIIYAAAIYCWTGEKTNFEEVFDRVDLNRVMAPYYTQIDNIANYKVSMGVNPARGKQAYDSEAIRELAAQGLSQKEICKRLGYDESKSRSLSSNRGYREGREQYLAGRSNQSESQLVCQEVSQLSVSLSESKKVSLSENQSESKKKSESQNYLQTDSESQSESKKVFDF